MLKRFLRHRYVLALFALVVLGGLCGCKAALQTSEDITQSDDYKQLHPADVKEIQDSSPGVADAIDYTTGKPVNTNTPSKRLNLDKIPTPATGDTVSTRIVSDDSNQEMTEGERQPGWIGLYDIYWKLNWIRKELLASNVPNNLRPVVARTRKHSQRIRKQFTDSSIDPCLDIVDEALDHLDKGLNQMATIRLLTEAGISWRSLPWSASENEVQRWLESQGILPSSQISTSTSQSGSDDDEEDSTRNRFLPTHTHMFIGSDKRKAAVLALDYAHQYHHSPIDEARKEFETALQNIIQLRNTIDSLLGRIEALADKKVLKYTNPSVSGDSFLIPGDLRQEPGGPIDRPDHYSPIDMDQSTHPGSSSTSQLP